MTAGPASPSSHLGDTATAALATLAAVFSVAPLVQSATWLLGAAGLVAVVAAVGVALRRTGAGSRLVVPAQLAAVALAVGWVAAPETTAYGLPTPGTAARVAGMLREFGGDLYSSTDTLPATTAVSLALGLAAAAIAVLVDDIAVTRQAPAAAGLPLLAVFLVAAANSGAPLAPAFFLLASAAWLAMVARQARARMLRWSTTSASPTAPARAMAADDTAGDGFGTAARRLGVTVLVLALAVPALLPHLPARSLLDGLAGRAGQGAGDSLPRVGFSSTVDVSRSLQSGSTTQVLRYTTTADVATPLRVVATSSYDGTTWRPTPNPGQAAPLELAPAVDRVERVVSVHDNTLDPPALAAPQPVIAADLRGTGWLVDEQTGDLSVASRPDSYSVTYLEPRPTAAMLRDGFDGLPGTDPLPSAGPLTLARRVDAQAQPRVRAAADEAAAGATTAYDIAMAIQAWLRDDARFTYSLTLPSGPEVAQLDPISAFLQTRTGYCVQFASAMVMMARSKGIPARMALGFLPGQRQPSGEYLVTQSDAHAWPELFFAGVGWVRFEPTPQVRTGTAPAWTLPAPDSAAAGSAGDTQNGASTGQGPRDLDRAADAGLDAGTETPLPLPDRVRLWFSQASHLVLLGALLGLLAALVLPVTAWALRLRRRYQPASDRLEAQWGGLTSRLSDLGMPPPAGGTLRDWEAHYRREARLDQQSQEALRELVSSVETLRYARPGAPTPSDLSAQVRTVSRAVARGRSVRERVRATLAPGEGLRWWRRFARRLSALAAWLAASARRAAARLGRSRRAG